MISADRDALTCDLAETYGIFDFRALPVNKLATLAVGLRENSRIKMKISGTKVSPVELLLAAAVDRLSFLCWVQSEDGRNNVNRPKSILGIIMGESSNDKNVESFSSAEQFEYAWNAIVEV